MLDLRLVFDYRISYIEIRQNNILSKKIQVENRNV